MKKEFLYLSTIFLILTCHTNIYAQVNLPDFDSVWQEGFNDFRGAGFDPSPTHDQLNSEKWRVQGLSDGDGSFGVTLDAGDFARGPHSGISTTGGIYGYEVSTGDYALGVQPTGSSFTPGDITLRVVNNLPDTIMTIRVNYDLYFLNNQDRSNSFNFRYSFDDHSWINVQEADFSSPKESDLLHWQSVERSLNLLNLQLKNADTLYLQWYGDDNSGSGSRDQFALNNLEVTTIRNDTNSLIIEPEVPLTGKTLSPVKYHSGKTAAEVFRWDVVDQGDDGIPTYIQKLTFIAGDQNTANWETTIDSLYIKQDTNVFIADSASIFQDSLYLYFDQLKPIAYDEDTTTFSLYILLNKTPITDSATLQFTLPSENHGLKAAIKSSRFQESFPETVNSAVHIININADRLNFSDVPHSTRKDAPFTIKAAATDAFGNVDISYSDSMIIDQDSGAGQISNLRKAKPEKGISVWDSLFYDTTGFFTLTVESSENNLRSDTTLPVHSVTFEVQDYFNVNDLNELPQWKGDTSEFLIYNDTQVPEGNAIASGSYLGSDVTAGDAILMQRSETVDEWQFSLASSDFNPSRNNYFGVILMSDSLIKGDYDTNYWHGYYLRIGNTGDTNYIELHRQDGGDNVKVGQFKEAGNLATGALRDGLNIKITRNGLGEFTLLYDSGFGYMNHPENYGGTVVDTKYFKSNWFGVFTNFTNPGSQRRVYIDNIEAWNNKITYVWEGGLNGSFYDTTSWYPPVRKTFPSDRLVIGTGDSVTFSGHLNRHGGNLIMKEHAYLNLQANTGSTASFTWEGFFDTSMVVKSGATLQLSGDQPVVFNSGFSVIYGEIIAGSSVESNQHHRLITDKQKGMIFRNGSALLAEGLSGSIFGNSGEEGVVIFEDGASYINQSGGNPFGLLQPESRVIFEDSSYYIHRRGLAPSLAGRTYGNFIADHSGSINFIVGSDNVLTILGDLKVLNGDLKIRDQLPIELNGNIKVSGQNSFQYAPPQENPSEIKLVGDSVQFVQGTGSIVIDSFGSLKTMGTEGLSLMNDLYVKGEISIVNGNIKLKEGDLIIKQSGNISGAGEHLPVQCNSSFDAGGSLVMYVDSQYVKFPVQSSTTFTPVHVRSPDTPAYIRVRVFDDVFEHGTSGNKLLNQDNLVKKSWKVVSDGDSVNLDLKLEWNQSDEGKFFNRKHSFISYNEGIESESSWEMLHSPAEPDVNSRYFHEVSKVYNGPVYAIGDDNSPLPVSWFYFEAEKEQPGIIALKWATATEFDNKGFEVQRSYHGKQWEKVLFKDGAGDSYDLRTYNAVDSSYIRQENAYVFYRIAQFDFDGTKEYSEIRAVKLSDYKLLNIEVFPNPCINCRITVKTEAAYNLSVEMSVFNLYGDQIFKDNFQVKPGVNTEVLPEFNELNPGVYILEYKSRGMNYRERLLIY